ncbi:hypothetical protein AVDCRST_MAG82-1, partial [uncultured Rubrobacteraceae bacterium]
DRGDLPPRQSQRLRHPGSSAGRLRKSPQPRRRPRRLLLHRRGRPEVL